MCVFVSGDCSDLKIPVVDIYQCYLYSVSFSAIVKPDAFRADVKSSAN